MSQLCSLLLSQDIEGKLTLFTLGCGQPLWIPKALQLPLLCIPAYVPAAQHCQIYDVCSLAVCCLTLNDLSSHIDQ